MYANSLFATWVIFDIAGYNSCLKFYPGSTCGGSFVSVPPRPKRLQTPCLSYSRTHSTGPILTLQITYVSAGCYVWIAELLYNADWIDRLGRWNGHQGGTHDLFLPDFGNMMLRLFVQLHITVEKTVEYNLDDDHASGPSSYPNSPAMFPMTTPDVQV